MNYQRAPESLRLVDHLEHGKAIISHVRYPTEAILVQEWKITVETHSAPNSFASQILQDLIDLIQVQTKLLGPAHLLTQEEGQVLKGFDSVGGFSAFCPQNGIIFSTLIRDQPQGHRPRWKRPVTRTTRVLGLETKL